jgi:hypothetical protein
MMVRERVGLSRTSSSTGERNSPVLEKPLKQLSENYLERQLDVERFAGSDTW